MFPLLWWKWVVRWNITQRIQLSASHFWSNSMFSWLFSISMLSALCGTVPSSLLVWAGPNAAVTRETGGGVASPQKSSGLNKPQRLNFIQCASVGSSKRRSSSNTRKEEEVVSQSCSGNVQIFCTGLFLFLLLHHSVQTSSRSALLLICQPEWLCGLSFFLSAHVSVLCYCVTVKPSASGSCYKSQLLL